MLFVGSSSTQLASTPSIPFISTAYPIPLISDIGGEPSVREIMTITLRSKVCIGELISTLTHSLSHTFLGSVPCRLSRNGAPC